MKENSITDNIQLIHLNIFINTLLGEYETANDALESMINQSEVPRFVKIHPIFDPVRNNPDYNKIFRKMNLN